jgi:hypothetical protein
MGVGLGVGAGGPGGGPFVSRSPKGARRVAKSRLKCSQRVGVAHLPGLRVEVLLVGGQVQVRRTDLLRDEPHVPGSLSEPVTTELELVLDLLGHVEEAACRGREPALESAPIVRRIATIAIRRQRSAESAGRRSAGRRSARREAIGLGPLKTLHDPLPPPTHGASFLKNTVSCPRWEERRARGRFATRAAQSVWPRDGHID